MSSLALDAGVLPLPRPVLGAPGRSHGRHADRHTDRYANRHADRHADHAADRAEVLKALVLRARDGDADAFGSLYDHYVELVYRYVYYRVGTHSLTEDLTSEVFLRALRRICDFHWQGKDFGAWLVTIARNLVADHFKSGRYRLEVCTAELVEPARHQEGPERTVLDSMTNRTLLTAVRRLGSEQQECVVLRFLHGLSVAETALVMDKKPGAIKALQYRAVRSLARMLPPDLRH
ncbi:sigma-70 family RNA polymerase sigma factor [Actinomadura sp. 7K507]|uniref:sigma-70 family RNA polymerase sigma factor n=1 Tax=Actinomadura sp. 7K507 TaxID=2530365 RepID=UPI001044FABC|nr:sigma-70 family RNA polymerase sigma factor [Actinomadura sp. 7K507]TDC82615.1 sigma-70 family RNA polymerase sigma factor [Actinomadura sp. 7K507]